MTKPRQGLTSAVGKKVVMAITGLALCLYLVAHLAGNLLLLIGPGQVFNTYAGFLHQVPFLLLVELGLLAIFLIHAYDALRLTLENKKARPVGYQVKRWARNKSTRSRKSASSTTMMVTGTIILIFTAFHVWHFKYNHPVGGSGNPVPAEQVGATGTATLGVPDAATPAKAQEEKLDLANLVITEFQKPLVTAIYMLAMLALGLHLYHAVSSAFQSLGVSNPGATRALLIFGRLFTIVIAGGFAFLPLWVLLWRR